MKHISLFENFEIDEPIIDGELLNNKEINFLQGYNILCPELILKDDNYYYVFNHRCENIKDVPETYINAVCSKYYIRKYTINDDHTIDVDGNVNISNEKLTKIPLKFNIVSGHFICSNNKLTTLEGSPKEVGTYFFCQYNNLTTLKGGPEDVGGNFYCNDNKLKTLEGSPRSVGGYFDCSENKLTTIECGPEHVGGNFYCKYNPLRQREYKGIIKGKLIYTQ